jgi:signal transduction histidine kinase
MKKRKKPIGFETDAALIDRLGRELVAKQETALVELVKNSFDADATSSNVVLTGRGTSAVLEISDNGSGMRREDIIHGFLRLASDNKVREPKSPRFRRQRAGRKGIGRFAAQRLGRKLILTTYAEGEQSAYRLTIDWDRFSAGKNLERVPVALREIAPVKVGTTLRIEGLRDEWTEPQIRRCWRSLVALQQPFPVKPVANRAGADPGFMVTITRRAAVFHDDIVEVNLQTEILDHLHAVIELEVDGKGHARWRFSKDVFGGPTDWTNIHHEHPDTADPPAYQYLRRVAMKTYYAILQPSLLPSLVFTRIRDVLSDQGGVRLYRNGFRVAPYGDPDNDWLRLDELYVKRTLLVPVANRNFFGIVEVRDPEGALFDEHTSREGLIETPAFLELRDLVSSVLVTATTRISHERGRKTHAGGGRIRSAVTLTDISSAVAAAQTAAEEAVRDGEPLSAKKAAEEAARAVRLVEEERSRLADEAAILRLLATLGMTTSEFSHETGMTFDAFRLDFERVFEAATNANPDDHQLLAQAERAKGMLLRLDTLTSYLNALAGARAVRGMRPISLSKALTDFEKGMIAQAKSRGIDLHVVPPPYDPLYTQPMHDAEIASVLLNFYTNSVKALKRSSGDRKILVEGERISNPERVRLRFSDTGDGVADDIRDRVFEPFFTTRVAPPAGASDTEHATGTGLGLWIVRQIAANVAGEVRVAEPPTGYSTCFELTLPAEEATEQ